jgi:CheY-like chemotaxis protein
MDQDNDDWLLDDEETPNNTTQEDEKNFNPWRILIVDDEPDIHTVTRLAIANVKYKNRGLEILSAYSAQEGLMIMRRENDIALVLLDVVMETDDAGLRMAKQIREDLRNNLTRIVLRTGQPGQAPERDVILNYDINDYKAKTELSSQKLFTTLIASLRTYESLVMIERSRRGMERILEASTDLYHVRSLREFASGVLNQISAILDVGADGVLCLQQDERQGQLKTVVMAATGQYMNYANNGQILLNSEINAAANRAFQEKSSRFEHPLDVLYVGTPEGHEFVILVSPPWPLAEPQLELLKLFCSKIAWAFDNLHSFDQLHQTQQAIVKTIDELLMALQLCNCTSITEKLHELLPRLESQTGHRYDEDILTKSLTQCEK